MPGQMQSEEVAGQELLGEEEQIPMRCEDETERFEEEAKNEVEVNEKQGAED